MSSTGKIQIDQLIGSENYIDWALRIRAVLIKDDLLEPIIEEKSQNNTKNTKALAIIQLFCAKGPLLYIKACTTAYKAWHTLEEIYNPKGFTTEFLTLKEFFDCKLDNFQTMEEYLHQIKTLLDDLSSKNIDVASQIKIL
jgi:gag-polypeptide of LTR copia-type